MAFFDDVLSALDTKTARAVFHRLFSREAGLFHKWGTTVVLATQAGESLYRYICSRTRRVLTASILSKWGSSLLQTSSWRSTKTAV